MLDNIFNRKNNDPEQEVKAEDVDQGQIEQADLEATEAEPAEDVEVTEALDDLPGEEESDFVLRGNDTEVQGDADEPLTEPTWPEAQAEDLEVSESEEATSLIVPPELAGSQLSFDEKVLEKIVSVAIKEMPGVLLADGGGGFFNLKTNKGVDINVDENDQVSLDLDLVLEYGKSAPDIYERLKGVLHERILQMTGLFLKNVNVHVVNILTNEEFAEKQ